MNDRPPPPEPYATEPTPQGDQYVIPGCRAEGFAITWGEQLRSKPSKAGKRAKYCCPTCGLAAWAKHEAALMCGDCGEEMECEG